MTTITKNALCALILSTLTTTLTTLSMEKNYPQLQLEELKKQRPVIHVDCSIMIPDGTSQTAYAMKTVHTAIFGHSNVQSTIQDPIMLFIIKQNSTDNQFYLPLPAKKFINCTDESLLHIHETNAYELLKSHPIFKKKQLLINAVCTKNPNFVGNSFAEQFNNTMNAFYKDPGYPWIDKGHKQELQIAGIITVVNVSTPFLVLGPHGPAVMRINKTSFEHGPNGCTNEKALIQSIIDEKIPENQNLFKSLMHRQINGSFPKK